MKKRDLKSLNLNKKSISNLNNGSVKGGTGGGQLTIEDGCVLSFGVLRCGATSMFFVCAAACAPDDK